MSQQFNCPIEICLRKVLLDAGFLPHMSANDDEVPLPALSALLSYLTSQPSRLTDKEALITQASNVIAAMAAVLTWANTTDGPFPQDEAGEFCNAYKSAIDWAEWTAVDFPEHAIVLVRKNPAASTIEVSINPDDTEPYDSLRVLADQLDAIFKLVGATLEFKGYKVMTFRDMWETTARANRQKANSAPPTLEAPEKENTTPTYYVELQKEYVHPNWESLHNVDHGIKTLFGVIPVEATSEGLALSEVKSRLDRSHPNVLQAIDPDIHWDAPLPNKAIYVDGSFSVTGYTFSSLQSEDMENDYPYNHSEVTDPPANPDPAAQTPSNSESSAET